MNKQEIEAYLLSKEDNYERDDYEKFLRKSKIACSAPAINVVGSNGKSATCRYLSSIYAANGYKVGLLTNAYADSPLECIQINGKPISEDSFSSLVKEYGKQADKNDLSAWQILAAFAFAYFDSEKVDLMILESNLGGDMDASFVEEENQKLVILTSLSLEHTSILGTTLSQIALNKISLLKGGSKLLAPILDDELKILLKETAEGVNSRFYSVDAFHFEKLVLNGYQFTYQPYKDVKIPAKALYLIKDASLAIEATSILSDEFPIDADKLLSALSTTVVPLCLETGDAVIFDGASNVEASEALVMSLPALRAPHVHMIFATEEDSNIAAMLPFLSNYCETTTLTTLSGVEGMRDESGYFFYTEDFQYIEDTMEAYRMLKEQYPDDYILFAGSKAFARAMRKLIKR